jgi:hypothetical protein
LSLLKFSNGNTAIDLFTFAVTRGRKRIRPPAPRSGRPRSKTVAPAMWARAPLVESWRRLDASWGNVEAQARMGAIGKPNRRHNNEAGDQAGLPRLGADAVGDAGRDRNRDAVYFAVSARGKSRPINPFAAR